MVIYSKYRASSKLSCRTLCSSYFLTQATCEVSSHLTRQTTCFIMNKPPHTVAKKIVIPFFFCFFLCAESFLPQCCYSISCFLFSCLGRLGIRSHHTPLPSQHNTQQQQHFHFFLQNHIANHQQLRTTGYRYVFFLSTWSSLWLGW